ncbi:hypothetical protein C8R45DRAFT_1032383 [Mycena sanguinolenta]|nr:hypothetical protein C8R45DRAFT_1032383 [Mycena sanguinolenta]
MLDPTSSSQFGLAVAQRGPRACTNCRRRKIKCDGVRPICSQCRTRPPRSKEPCQYPPPEGQNTQEGLENSKIPDPTRIYLNQPYDSRSQSHSPELPGKLVSVGSVLVFKSAALQI